MKKKVLFAVGVLFCTASLAAQNYPVPYSL